MMLEMKEFIKKNIGLVFYAILLLTIAILDPHKSFKSHMLFYVAVIGVTIILMFWKNCTGKRLVKISIICIISLTTVFITIIGARHHFISDVLFYNIVPGKATTLIERAGDAGDSGVLDSTFTIYYFKNKEILCYDEEVKRKIKENLTDKYYSESFYNYEIITDKELIIDDTLIDIGTAFPRYIDNYGNVYVVDDGIRFNQIVCISEGDYLVYCSKELYLSSMGDNIDQGEYIEPSNDTAIVQLSKLLVNYNSGSNITNTMRTQMIAICVFWLVGLIICIALWDKLGGWLLCMLAIPVGVIVWSFFGTILVVTRLPYNLYTQGGIIITLLALLIYKKKANFTCFNYLELFIPVVIVFLSLIYYTTACYTTTSYDSIKKLQLGYMLAVNNKPYLLFTNVAIYGLIEPFIHSMGYMLGGDYLYAIYPMFYNIIIGLIGGGLYRVYESKKSKSGCDYSEISKYIILMGGLAIYILITNVDFRYAKHYAMSHIIVAAYILIFMLFIFFHKDNSVDYPEWGLYLSTFAIIITRTEGIIYILFLLTLLAGYISDKQYRKFGYVICMLCITWTIVQLLLFNGNDGDGYFFSPKKSIILISGSLMAGVYLFLISKGKLSILLKKNYIPFYLFAMLFAIIVVSIKVGEMSVINFEVYIGHLSSFIERNMNSGYLWGLIFMSIPFLFIIKKDISDISIGVMLGYLGLVFLIFLFRKELPMREGLGDSGRRMLVHIMPTSVFLILASLINEAIDETLQKGKGVKNA